jgi:hypothetical protein
MNLHLPSAITITALVNMWLSLNRTPPREPQGRALASEWVQNGMRGPPTGSANLAMGKSPVERGTVRAYLQHSRERSLLPTIPSRGHRRADVRRCHNTQTPLAFPRFPSAGPMARLLDQGRVAMA